MIRHADGLGPGPWPIGRSGRAPRNEPGRAPMGSRCKPGLVRVARRRPTQEVPCAGGPPGDSYKLADAEMTTFVATISLGRPGGRRTYLWAHTRARTREEGPRPSLVKHFVPGCSWSSNSCASAFRRARPAAKTKPCVRPLCVYHCMKLGVFT